MYEIHHHPLLLAGCGDAIRIWPHAIEENLSIGPDPLIIVHQ